MKANLANANTRGDQETIGAVPGYLAGYQDPQNVCSSMFVLKMQLYKYKRTRRALIPMILANVKSRTMFYTDGWKVGMFDARLFTFEQIIILTTMKLRNKTLIEIKTILPDKKGYDLCE